MKELLEIIDQITKYGLNPDIDIVNKEKDLEINLVRLYSKYFQINYEVDKNAYEDLYKKEIYPNVVDNVRVNFKDFGWYHSIINVDDVLKEPKTGIGDAVDDLSDIVYDLLEIKWRSEKHSENDALWFFELIFHSHTQQHLINLLNYLKNKSN